MDGNVFVEPEIKKLLEKYVVAELYTDRRDSKWGPIDDANRKLQSERFGDTTLPLYVTLTSDGKETGRYAGSTQFGGYREFVEFMERGLGR